VTLAERDKLTGEVLVKVLDDVNVRLPAISKVHISKRTLIMQQYGPTASAMRSNAALVVTSTDTARFVRFDSMSDSSRFATAEGCLSARCAYVGAIAADVIATTRYVLLRSQTIASRRRDTGANKDKRGCGREERHSATAPLESRQCASRLRAEDAAAPAHTSSRPAPPSTD